MSIVAAAYRIVIDHLTPRVLTAGTRTRILALVVETRLGQRTLCADHAFWSTGRRTANES